ncbi:unnamed protein product [Brassicogethes aeneus]|uniref:mitogen-activated protein kinase kinase n=1 Tax=Brassicogethes aeneus TaxID=1431903 RepID=A0A9P0B7X4_BRAAE|nr:unnamed protein product [Brassicogethes aeneus]
MSSNEEKKINDMLDRLRHGETIQNTPMNSPRRNLSILPIGLNNRPNNRPSNLNFTPKPNDNAETERRLKEIMKISGSIKIDGRIFNTDIKQLEDIEELGNGTCGHVVKMKHVPSKTVIAVKQMRRSGNKEETKRIIMDIEVVLKSHDCKFIVQCLGCFITDSEVWICMELMDTCFEKLLKKLKQPVPEEVLGKVTYAVVEALSYLKDKHDVIHRDVKPSNILLDKKGNVKLCDFGISGRLVDSMAKTRSAGCAAYMAPERIEPDPQNPDYDVRADVWSLGITLVELATGVFPYKDCKTDFEVLTKVLGEAPPYLPEDKEFSHDFRDFVKCCLTKNKQSRPKYAVLKNHTFMKKYEKANVNVGEWFTQALGNGAAPRHSFITNPIRQFFSSQQSKSTQHQQFGNLARAIPKPIQQQQQQQQSPQQGRVSRLSIFQAQREPQNLNHNPQHQSRMEFLFQPVNNVSTNQPTSYSPYRAFQNHVAATQNKQDTSRQQESHIPLRIHAEKPTLANHHVASESKQHQRQQSPLPPRRGASEGRWRSPSASPLPLRSQIQAEDAQYNHGNTSPIVLQRFYHQQKQQQLAKEAEENGKKKFSSYIKLQLTGDRSGRSSRHQSPEPPPRLNRTVSGESQSPLTLRRNFLETHTPNSPSLSKRYISPTPPIPPPRKLSESSSVPGSPQHFRARFHYTPEPQRRLFQNNDVS